MRKTLIAAAGTLVVVGAVGVAVAQSSSADSRAKSHGFTVVERAVTDTTTDTGAKGDSVGDILTFHNPIYGKANKHRVGTDNGVCTRTVKGKAYECQWSLQLAHGSLLVAGPFYDTRDSVLAITGGTGKYAEARGDMVLHALNAQGTAYRFTYRIH